MANIHGAHMVWSSPEPSIEQRRAELQSMLGAVTSSELGSKTLAQKRVELEREFGLREHPKARKTIELLSELQREEFSGI